MAEKTKPESVGMSSSHMDVIDITLKEFIDSGKLAGMIALIARRGKVVKFDCYGKLDVSADKPVQADSLFRIASLTKPITSVGVLMLYEQGYFNLDDPVSKWIPSFKNFKVLPDVTNLESEPSNLEREITFRHLLTHTSGLGYGFDPDSTEPIERIYLDEKIISPFGLPQLSLPQMIDKVSNLPIAFQPGKTWKYSIAHDVLGYLISLISGKPFDVYLRERIFEPLGMQDTSFYVPPEKLERFGPLYGTPNNDGLPEIDNVSDSPYVDPDVVPSGGAGLVSSMPDYFRFMLMLANGGELDGTRYLKSETVNEMTTNQITGFSLEGVGYGLGIGVKVTDIQKFGWIGISGTSAWIFPRDEMIVISMTQASFFWDASSALQRIAYDAIMT